MTQYYKQRYNDYKNFKKEIEECFIEEEIVVKFS